MISILPYMLVDGIPTFSDSELLKMFYQMKTDGTWKYFFYLDSRVTPESFLYKVKNYPDAGLYVAMIDDEPCGFVFLDNIKYKTAHFHFCTLRKFSKQLKEVSTFVYNYLLEKYSTLLGIVPASNRLVSMFASKFNLKPSAIIPDYFYNDLTLGYEDANLFIMTRR